MKPRQSLQVQVEEEKALKQNTERRRERKWQNNKEHAGGEGNKYRLQNLFL